jgi:hypothetical protein
MPLKHNITKYDVLATKIHKITISNGTNDQTEEEKRTKVMAVLIASFSSSQAWQTHNIITENPANLGRPEVREEYRQALFSRWKTISAADISEVINKDISDNAFSSWLFYAVEPHNHSMYKMVWQEMKEEFMEACDDVEITYKKA